MTGVWSDSFGWTNAVADLAKRYTAVTTSGMSIIAGPRASQQALRILNNGTAVLDLTLPTTPNARVIVGIRFKIAALVAIGDFITLYDGTTVHDTVSLLSNGTLQVERAGTTLIAGPTTEVATAEVWHYLCVNILIGDAGVGEVEMRLDNNEVIAPTVLDTRNAGTAQVTRIAISGAGGGADIAYCDYVIVDGAGSSNNTTLTVDPRVDYLGVTGAGATTQLDPSAGSNYQNVDEVPPSTADYNSTDVLNELDTYAIADLDLLTSQQVFFTNAVALVHKDDAGARSGAAVLRSGGTDFVGANLALSTTEHYTNRLDDVDPFDSATWTRTKVNATEPGAKLTV